MAAKESKSLTLALLNITFSKVYLEDVAREFPAIKRRVGQWIAKLDFITNDSFSSMTSQGREVFRREILKGDPMQYENIFALIAEMSPEQRNLYEKAGEGILKGQIEIVET